MSEFKKLQLGAGTNIKDGFINLDYAALPGIDVVHDLNIMPWPFNDNSFTYVLAEDVLEHLDKPIEAIQEMHRITAKDGILDIQVPYWNSWSANTDLSHRHRFTEHSFDYFDPTTTLGKIRFYYSPAKVLKIDQELTITPILPWLPLPKAAHFVVKMEIIQKILFTLAGFFCNIIQDYRVRLKIIK